MTHSMNLHARPFEMIASGQKTIELRLYDEKRQAIQVGDTIVFSNRDRQLRVTVKKLHIFSSFEELYKALPLERCGYLSEELPTASPKDMELYYSAQRQKDCGVVGIEVELL